MSQILTPSASLERVWTERALSIRQPWAWLIAEGYKPVENRTWRTNLRGIIAIHASKTIDAEGYNWVRERFPAITLPTSFDVGSIIALVSLVDCVDEMRSPWFVGPRGFLMQDPQPVPPIRERGKQGFFRVSDGARELLSPHIESIPGRVSG